MIITETNLRSIIREILVENYSNQKRDDLNYGKKWNELKVKSWTSSKVDTIEQVKIGDKYYFSFGFIEQGDVKGLGIKIPKSELGYVRGKLGKAVSERIIDKAKEFKIVKPNLGNYKKHADYKDDMVISIPEGTPNVILGVSTFDSGETSTAAYTTLALDIFGAVPLIGNAADAANVFVQLSMKPPKYFGAFLSFLGAIPAIGILFAGAKIISKSGEIKSAVRAGGILHKEMLKAAGYTTLRELAAGKSVFRFLDNHRARLLKLIEDNFASIERVVPDIRRIYPEFVKFLDDFFDAFNVNYNFSTLGGKLGSIARYKELARQFGVITQRGKSAVKVALTNEFRERLSKAFGVEIPSKAALVDASINSVIAEIDKTPEGEFSIEQMKIALDLDREIKKYAADLKKAGIDIKTPT